MEINERLTITWYGIILYSFSKIICFWNNYVFDKQVGMSDEIHAKTPDSKHSVSFPKELASATKVKSESTAGLFGIFNFVFSFIK